MPTDQTKVTTPPTTTVITLDEAKSQLRVDSTDEESLIAGYVWAAQQLVEDHTGTALLSQTLTQTRAEFPPGAEPLHLVGPLQSVSSITYWATSDSSLATTLPSSDYTVNTAQSAVVPLPDNTWPTVRSGASPGVQVQHVSGSTITPSTNGSSGIDGTLGKERNAVRLIVSHFWENRGDEGAPAMPAAATHLINASWTGGHYEP